MIQQSLLAKIAALYDFNRASQLVALPQSKPFIRSWMTLDFSQPLINALKTDTIDFAVPYQQNDDKYVKYNTKTSQIERCEKRFASKADLTLTTANKRFWFEFHALHQDDLMIKKNLNKLYGDANRVSALRQAFPKDEVMLLIGLWGRFSSEDIRLFHPLDNNKQCAYVLDSSLTGSTQIARLSQMKKAGEERFLLIGV